MKFFEQDLKGVYIIEPEPYSDDRGMLRRHFCIDEFRNYSLMTDIKQCNVSENIQRYTLRGFHCQSKPYGENKLISCIHGEIYDIVLDLRRDSGTYLQWQSFELSKENRRSLYVPVGCANAYLTLQENTWILYYHSQVYTPSSEQGIRYNDPAFKFEWPAKPMVISEKDLNYSDFDRKIYGID
ncbi:MAG: dTDP-4-dehydrorhamnose 3,5-epimerase family protein [Proteobacteria bacterium]|nr:dTDP-4-dehydrorhamnose 3,5-epimerase family protein [Pseudomonadota bacterium]MBU1389463.1 dTDP-4-dehydrorhamnose 3,5-epimerase family protein [Pseudomonadota bacterium]MBU1541283.1 dTDP-4-dehydrorhamnose 3,5-epimerase family protein [Pseudomonadota bacterium]MBU2430158.1 dTDP-4-dehydrorhamnose 3,5-epimerase family protein [Pseudomonadota bacterium]